MRYLRDGFNQNIHMSAIDSSKPQSEQTPRPIFVYGSLLNDQVFARVLQGAKPKRIDQSILKGFKKYQVRGAPYPAAIKSLESSEIVGGLLYLSDFQQLTKLDAFESDLYRRETVDVLVAQDKGICLIESDVYIWNQDISRLEERDWSYEKFISKLLTHDSYP